MLTLSMVLFGTIGICRRFIPLPSDVLACGRGAMGGVFLLLVLKAEGQGFRLKQVRRKSFFLLVLSGVLIGVNWILLFEAYNYTTVAVATLCYYMQPVIIILLSPVILKEKMKGKQILCAAVSVTGMVLVSGAAGGGAIQNPKGIALGLGAAVLYASVVIMNKCITGFPALEKTIIQLFRQPRSCCRIWRYPERFTPMSCRSWGSSCFSSSELSTRESPMRCILRRSSIFRPGHAR